MIQSIKINLNKTVFTLNNDAYNKLNNYFSDLKATYPETFFVKVFFYNKKPVAFVSSFLMPKASIEAHYIGFNYELNTKLDLYQNILYSLIKTFLSFFVIRTIIYLILMLDQIYSLYFYYFISIT